MKKRIFSLLLIALTLCLSLTVAHAATPDDVTQPQVAEKLDLLLAQLENKYFTTTQKAAASDASAGGMVNVVATDWLKKATGGMVPDSLYTSGTFTHYYNGKTLVRGKSCCGFANYAQWYLFAQDSKDIVKTKEIAFVEFNKSNMLKYAQPGDAIRLGSSKTSNTHSAIVYSINDTNITVVDSNWDTDTCKVTKHTIKYSSYAYVGITRATNYEYPTGWYTIDIADDSEGLRQRSGPTSEYTMLQRVPDGAKVKVIDTVGFWGQYEYNGIVGWSNMDYMAFRGTYVDTVTFDAGGGSGEMEPLYFDVGTGFQAPECGFTRPGYQFLGWTLENEDIGKFRCVSADGSTLKWLTEASAKTAGYTKHVYAVGATYNRIARIDKAASFRMTAQWAYVGCAAPTVKISNNAATGQPRLTWDAVEGAAQYEIWRATAKNGTYYKLWTTASTTYNNTTAQPGKTYYYKVCALDAEGRAGAFSAVRYITCDCAQPQVSITIKASTGQPQLTWKAVAGAEKYEIWRATDKDGAYTKMWTTTATSYTNTTARPGVTYYYKVRAIDEASAYAASADSAVRYITCDCAQPQVSIALNSAGKPCLTWKAVDGAAKYYIYRAVGDGEFAYYYSTTATTFNNTSAAAGTLYRYQVRAAGSTSYANSALSPVVSITAQ